MAITRLWFFTLKQGTTTPTDPNFLALWAQILDLCASYTPTPTASSSQVHVAHISTPHPQRPHHFLFACHSSSTSPSSTDGQPKNRGEPSPPEEDEGPSSSSSSSGVLFVLISTYPSLALCSQADAAYKLKFQPRLFEMVDHLSLRQMDMEEPETVPALLTAARKRDHGVTVTISSRDPLRVEVEGAGGGGGGGKSSVVPLDQEISGADVYDVPAAPLPSPVSMLDGKGGGGVDGDAKRNDIFQTQRDEGKKWIRISRGWDIEHQDGEVEVFRLKEVISR